MKAGSISYARMLYALLGILTAGIVAFAVFQPIKVLPRSTLAPGFALTDASGAPVNNETLRGRLVVYHFASSKCGDACDAGNVVMRALQQQLAARKELPPVSLVTFNLESPRNAADQTELADQLGAQPTSWRVLSGDARAVKRVVGGGFRVFYNDTGAQLEPALMLVDGWGILRAEYREPVPDLARIERDLGLLSEEARNSHGAARLAYEAAHLFLCYP